MSSKLRLPSHRYQIPLFELPLTIKVQKAGFQIREDGALLVERGNASVRGWYTRTGLPKFASYSMSTKLRLPSHRYQIPLFELPLIGLLVMLVYSIA